MPTSHQRVEAKEAEEAREQHQYETFLAMRRDLLDMSPFIPELQVVRGTPRAPHVTPRYDLIDP